MRRPLSDKILMASNLVLLAIVLFACSPSEQATQEQVPPRDSLPVLVGDTVTTLISDSGITRYRIETTQWLVFDKKEPTYQEFPKGIYLEQFDEALTVQASLKADYAYYNEPDQHWTLRGNVHAMNRKGEHFDTQELKWDQKTHRVYSDSAIHITRDKSIIEGVGFESNEEMSKYTIMHPTGVFPIDDEEEAQPAEEPVETVTAKEEPAKPVVQTQPKAPVAPKKEKTAEPKPSRLKQAQH